MLDLTTMNAVLDYLRLPLADLIKKKVHVLNWAAERMERGGGKQVLIPARVAEETATALGGGWIGDGAALTAETTATPLQLTVPYRFYARRLQVSGPTIEAAGESKSQLENAIADGLELLVDSIGSQLNRFSWSGGSCVGFLHEHEDKVSGSVWEFDGDAQKMSDYVAGGLGAVTVQLVDTDDYAQLTTATCTAVAIPGSTVTLTDGGGVGAANVDTSVAGVGSTAGRAIAVIINSAAHTAVSGIQPIGLYGNLGLQTHFGLNRSAAGNARLRSNVFTMATAGDHDRADVTLARLQILLDEITSDTRGMGRPDRAFFNPSLRSELATLFQATATMQVNIGDGKGIKVDAGVIPGGFSYGGIPFEEDVDCGHGMIVFVQDNTWVVPTLRKGDWDGPGYVVQGTDRVDRPWKQYHNVVCKGPNFAGAIVGLDFPGAAAGTG